MNIGALVRHYDRLTPRERIPLLLAADARGDDIEHRRLHGSAPVKLWRLPDYLMASRGLNVLALIYITEQQRYLADYWHALWRLDDPSEPPDVWRLMADISAYVFTCNAEAWRRFCEELNINPHQLRSGNDAEWWMLDYAEEHMPGMAPRPDELATRFRQYGHEGGKLVTAEALLASWQGLFQALTRGHQ